MVNRLKEYWFGILMCFIVIVCLIYSLIVVMSPHSDGQMRGFAPCTYELAINLSQQGGQSKVWGVAGAVTQANLCYVGVIRKGVELWVKGKQPTPWANYMYEPESFYEDENVEPISKELLEANLLDDEEGEVVKIVDEKVEEVAGSSVSESVNIKNVGEGSNEQM